MPKGTYSLNLKRVERFVFYLLIFFLPTQIAYHFWPNWALRFGIRVDYLAPAIYLSDLLIVALILISKTKVKTSWLAIAAVFALINIFYSVSPWASLFKWLKVFEIGFLVVWTSKNRGLFKEKGFLKALSSSLIFISVVGIAQFILGKTIGGPLYLFGERSFNIGTPGIALENIFGKIFLRPYSIFSHPNSLAGYLGLVLILFPKVGIVPRVFSGLTFFLSGSMEAFLGFLSSAVFRKIKKMLFIGTILLSLTMPFYSFGHGIESLDERFYLARIACRVIKDNFLFGTGLNTFVTQNSLLQPVHNMFLLVFSELGLLGFIFFLGIIYKGLRKNPAAFIFILVTGLTDHYWLTLQQNMLLLALVFGMVL